MHVPDSLTAPTVNVHVVAQFDVDTNKSNNNKNDNIVISISRTAHFKSNRVALKQKLAQFEVNAS